MSVIGNPLIFSGNLRTSGIIVPNTYQQVEYVAIDTSGPYIDLGFVPSNHYIYAEILVVSYVGNSAIFGTDVGQTAFHMTEYSNKWYWGAGGSDNNSGTVAVYAGGWHEILYNKGANNEVIVNQLTLGSGKEITVAAGNNLYLAKRANRQGLKLRYYIFQVTDKSTGNLIRNLIPVYRISDNEVGFWDECNNIFYTNDNTGSFIAGPDVT